MSLILRYSNRCLHNPFRIGCEDIPEYTAVEKARKNNIKRRNKIVTISHYYPQATLAKQNRQNTSIKYKILGKRSTKHSRYNVFQKKKNTKMHHLRKHWNICQWTGTSVTDSKQYLCESINHCQSINFTSLLSRRWFQSRKTTFGTLFDVTNGRRSISTA